MQGKKTPISGSKRSDNTKSRFICDYLRISSNWISRNQISCRWERPNDGEYVLNADGSVRGDNFSCGGLLRDSSGEPILCFSAKEGCGLVLEQELRAVDIGLKLAIDCKVKKIAVASDSQVAVWILSNKVKSPWYMKNLVKSICNSLSRFSFGEFIMCLENVIEQPIGSQLERAQLGYLATLVH